MKALVPYLSTIWNEARIQLKLDVVGGMQWSLQSGQYILNDFFINIYSIAFLTI